MARVFITGSADGLGRAAAQSLMAEGHQVVLHARSSERGSAIADLAPKAAGVVIGDLSSAAETRAWPSRSTRSAVWTPSFTTQASTMNALAARPRRAMP